MKKLFLLLLPLVMLVAVIPFNGGYSTTNEVSAITKKDLDEYEIKTTSDYKAVDIRGDSYFEEDIIYYRNYNNINHYDGYNLSDEDVNCLSEFYVYFDEYSDPTAYFSIEFRASACGSVLADEYYVAQNGYCFVFHHDGAVQIYKNHNSTPIASLINGPHFASGDRVLFKGGVLEEYGNARLVMFANNILVYDEYDEVDPIISGGNYLNFCSWKNYSNLKARIVPTRENIPVKYKTYTLSTLNVFPTRSGYVEFKDNYNNLHFSTGWDTAGFAINEQNYSFEMQVNFTSFNTSGVAFYVGLRCTSYGRANSGSVGGYTFGLGNGTLYVNKAGVKNFGIYYFTPIVPDGKPHILEYGTVDIDNSTTYLFVKLDGTLLATVYDTESPCQNRGMLLLTNEGEVIFDASSSSSYAEPLKTKHTEEQYYDVYTTYFHNSVSFMEGENYNSISPTNLKSIYINGLDVVSFNAQYYGTSVDQRAIDISFVSNTIVVKIAKNMHKVSDDEVYDFTLERFKLQKSGQEYGLSFKTGYKLKYSYFYIVK